MADSPRRRYFTALNVLLTVVAAAATAAMTWMGFWQLSLFDTRQHEDAVAMLRRDPVPLSQAIGPDQAFPGDGVGRPVTFSGTYAVDDTFVVQRPTARPTVVTPLRTASGSLMFVQRGFGDDLDTPTPRGRVTVTGFLEPNDPEVRPLDRRRRTNGFDSATLVNQFDRDLYSAYVVLESQDPAETLAPVQPPLPDPGTWTGLRNLLYAIQWWVFAGFAVLMWWQIVIQGSRDVSDETPVETPSGEGSTTPVG